MVYLIIYIIINIVRLYIKKKNYNNIYINDNYIYTKKYSKSNNFIKNISNKEFKFYDYYYQAVQIIINTNNNFNNNKKFELLILDLSNIITPDNKYEVIELSNTLFYTQFCSIITEDNQVPVTTSTSDSNFKLKNQKKVDFDQINNAEADNIYILNKNTNYIEPNPPYKLEDKYGNILNYSDFSYLVTSTAPQTISEIKDITNNYETTKFSIIYNYIDYELNYN